MSAPSFVGLKEFSSPVGLLAVNSYDRKVFIGTSAIYVCGEYTGDLSASYPGLTNVGTKIAAFLVKLSLSGDHIWSKSIIGSNTAYSYPFQLSVIENSTSDKNGVYLIGTYEGVMEPYINTTGAWSNGFAMKFDSNGNFIWGRRIDGTFNDYGSCVHATNNGVFTGFNIYNNAQGSASIYTENGTLMSTISGLSTTNSNIVVIRFNHDGSVSSGMTPIVIAGLATANSIRGIYAHNNDLFLCGTMQGSYTTPTYPFAFTSSGNYSGFILKYTITGTYVTIRRIISSGTDNINSIVVDSTGIYACGRFDANVTSDSEFVSLMSTSNGHTGFLMKLNNDSALSLAWAKTYDQAGSVDEFCLSVALGDDGVYVSLRYLHSTTFPLREYSKIGPTGTVTNTIILSNEYTTTNLAAAFVKYDFNGVRLYTQKSYDSTFADLGTSISIQNGMIVQAAIRDFNGSQSLRFLITIYSEPSIIIRPITGNYAYAYFSETSNPTESIAFTYGYYIYNNTIYSHVYNVSRAYIIGNPYQIYVSNVSTPFYLTINDVKYGGTLSPNQKGTLTQGASLTVSSSGIGYLLFNTQTFEAIIAPSFTTSVGSPTGVLLSIKTYGQSYSIFKNNSLTPLTSGTATTYIDNTYNPCAKYNITYTSSGKSENYYYGNPELYASINPNNSRIIDLSFNFAIGSSYNLYRNGSLIASNQTTTTYSDLSAATATTASYYITVTLENASFTSNTVSFEIVVPYSIVNVMNEYGKAYIRLINLASTTTYDVLGSYDNINFVPLATGVSGEAIVNLPVYEGTYYIKTFIAGVLNDIVPVKLTNANPSTFAGGLYMTYNKNGSIYDSNRFYPKLASVPILEGKKIIKYVYTGTSSWSVLDTSGFVYSFGSASLGGSDIPDAIQVCISGTNLPISNIKDIYSTTSSFAALDNSGQVYVWGNATTGGSGLTTFGSIRCIQLLLNTTNLPITNVTNIYANTNAFVAVDALGSVYVWGSATAGGSGLNTTGSIRCIQLLLNTTNLPITNIKNVYYTQNAFAVVDTSGSVYVWGSATTGGSGLTTVGSISCIQLLLNTTNLPITNIKNIYANANAFAALDNSGQVYIWGNAGSGGSGLITASSIRCIELLLNTTNLPITNIKDIYLTQSSFAAVDVSGSAYIWGNGSTGGSGLTTTGSIRCIQLLLNTTNLPVRNIVTIGGNVFSFAATDASGSVYIWGNAGSGGSGLTTVGSIRCIQLLLNTTNLPVTNIKNIYFTQNAFAALDNSGQVYIWGSATAGGSGLAITGSIRAINLRLENQTIINDIIDINFSTLSFFAVGKTGYYTWGEGYAGGSGFTFANFIYAYKLDSYENHTIIMSTIKSDLAINKFSVLGIITDNRTYLLGSRALAANITNVSYQFPLNNVNKVFTTSSAFAALTNSGEVYVWNASTSGGSHPSSVFISTNPPIIRMDISGEGPLRNIRSIYSSSTAFAALDNSGQVYIWGSASDGGSGNVGSINPYIAPTCIRLQLNTGGFVNNIKGIIPNSNAFAALDNSGKVYIWGSSNAGGSGLTTVGSISAINLLLNTTGLAIDNIHTIYSNTNSFAALDLSGQVYIWGNATAGGSGLTTTGSIRCIQLLINTSNTALKYVKTIYATPNAFAALDLNKNVYIWGNASTGGSGLTTTGSIRCILLLSNSIPVRNINTIYANSASFAALDLCGQVYIWGNASTGGSGLTTAGSISAIQLLISPSSNALQNIKDIYYTGNAFAALDNSGEVYIWGLNTQGGSGLTTTGSIRCIPLILLNQGTLRNINGIYAIYKPFGNYVNQSFSATDASGNIYAWGVASSGGSGLTTTGSIAAIKINTYLNEIVNASYTIYSFNTGYIAINGDNVFIWGGQYASQWITYPNIFASKLNDPFSAKLSNTNLTISNLETQNLYASIYGGALPYKFEWYKENQLVSTDKNPLLQITNNYFAPNNSLTSTYRLKVTDALNASIDLSSNIIFGSYVSISAIINSTFIKLNLLDEFTFIVSAANGKGPYIYSWYEISGTESILLNNLNSLDVSNNYVYYPNNITKNYKVIVSDALNASIEILVTVLYDVTILAFPCILENSDIKIYDANNNITTKKIQNLQRGDFICSNNLNKVKVKFIYTKTITANNDIYSINLNGNSINCHNSAYINSYSILYSLASSIGSINSSYNGQEVKLYHIHCYNFTEDDIYINNIRLLSYGLASDILSYDPVVGSYILNSTYSQSLRKEGTAELYIKPADTRPIIEEIVQDPVSGENILIRRIQS